MRTIRIYHAGELVLDKEVVLAKPASLHLTKVLRLSVDAPITLFNGDGFDYPSNIVVVKKEVVVARPVQCSKNNNESSLQLHLGQAMLHSSKIDVIIQKAVELGVTDITPIISEYCHSKLSTERWEKKITHWQNMIISACEQSERATIPQLHQPIFFAEYVVNCTAELKLILHPRLLSAAPNLPQSVNSIALLIGPEGGFSPKEVILANQQHFKSLQLGPRILRTETAAIASMAIAQSYWGDSYSH